ncbi:BMP family protein [Halanaerobiaceae bacterium Z-7014]|uniref:BMP family protein n=1 Tax=Halonatronomonas betaini TaxID=2778430 RepID=A0A931FAT2_9FIRM|nr:BMP family protein [Halonatronomonas betaini]MBF8437292.1 BMP family protein [Halonatronomonas betaini]
MIKKLSVISFLFIFVTIFSLAGIVSAEDGSVSIAMIFPSTIDDMAWSQAMYEGVMSLQEELGEAGISNVSYSENLYDAVQVGSAMREYAPDFDIVIAHGAQYQNIVDDVARDFPNTTFAYGTSYNAMHDNVYAYDPHAEEGAYLAGIIAAHVTETGIVGVIGPVEAGDAIKYNTGFMQGVESIDPDIEIRVGYTGSFGDTVAAREMAETQIDEGADVLTGSAQQTVGAIRAAAEAGVYWLSTDIDQSSLAPDTVIASQSLNFKEVVRYMIDARDEGIYGGEHLPLSFANGFLTYDFNENLAHLIDEDLQALIDDTIEQIINGEITIEIN